MSAPAMRPNRAYRNRLIREEAKRSESVISVVRVAVGVAGVATGLLLRSETPELSFWITLIVAGIEIGCGAGAILLIRSGRYFPAMTYILTAVDILIVTGILWGFGAHRTFKSPALLFYFLTLIAAAYRFSIWLTIFTGVLCVGSYIALLAAALALGRIELGSVSESFSSSAVSIGDFVVRIWVFVFAVALLAAVAAGYHRLIRTSVMSELRSYRQRLEKLRIKETLSRYVTHQIAEVILENGVNLQGEHRSVTVLFCDIRDFTQMSSALAPEKVVSFLNEFLSMMVDTIFQYGGTLDKFTGDGLMAVFGAPMSQANDEEQAVRAAVRIRESITEKNTSRRLEGKDPVYIGIGIHTGEVVAGNVGSEKRLDYTVIGSTVNVASRIEGLTKRFQTDILISEDTYSQVHKMVEAREHEPTRVRGLEDSIKTYSVLRFV